MVDFDISRKETRVLVMYGAGGIILVLLLRGLFLGLDVKTSDLVNVWLYWTVLFSILLGANALSDQLGKGGDSSAKSPNKTK